MEETIRTLECRAFNAWPALQTVLDDGWVLRFAAGYTKRANSANALWPARGPLDAQIAFVESQYRRRGLPPVFRLTPLAGPEIDAALAARGYVHLDDSLVMTAALAGRPVPPDLRLDFDPCRGWIDAFIETAGADASAHAKLSALLAQLGPNAAFARRDLPDGTPAAFAMAVAERAHVGIFEVLCAPAARRQGHARAIVEGLMGWGRAQGAATAYLQVVAANAPAVALYRGLGFAPLYGYHYRIAR
jgi:ribosomal protein S18 acetylase RimI-like enzyme